jgi:hypothetical protein
VIIRKNVVHAPATLLKAQGHVVGYLAAHDTDHHPRWDLVNGSRYGNQDDTSRPRIIMIWAASVYRHAGVGTRRRLRVRYRRRVVVYPDQRRRAPARTPPLTSGHLGQLNLRSRPRPA